MSDIKRFKVTNDLSEEFSVNVCKRMVSKANTHWHDFYEIELCLNGTGTTIINGKIHKISKGYISFLTPSDFHSFDIEEPLEILNLSFAPHWIEYSEFSELLQLINYQHSKLPQKKFEKINFIIENIKSEILENEYLNKKYVSHLLACLIIEFLRITNKNNSNEPVQSEYSVATQKLLYYIHTYFKEDITLESAASYVDLTAGYISKLFKKSFGYGFKEYLTDLRLRHAENMLLNTNKSIADIGYSCGYQSSSHFLRTFNKKHNMSPKEFRKKNNIKVNKQEQN